uniref:E3 ubiquitin-protein ligase TRIM39-like n=1 Tax=Oncorhynchus tshawytscha TaxID=74940 RepID=A0A8C8C8B7_ONCTS
MATSSSLLSEEQFLYSICLDLFTEPVTTPCGHNFCKACIRQYWDSNDLCLCPMCKEKFHRKPALRINTFISEMAAHRDQCPVQPLEVPCDIYTGMKLKALKSCLVVPALKRHKLIKPVENLEDRMCKKHGRLLELFCRTDLTCLCVLCFKTDHMAHDIVPIEEEYEEKKVQLGKTEAEVQQMIQERLQKVQEIKHSVDLSKKEAQRDIKQCICVHCDICVGTVMGAVSQLEEALMREVRKLCDAELKRIQLYTVDVTLDPDTAYPKLALSEDWKQVRHEGTLKNLSDNPERFDSICCVLGKKGFFSGRFYYEVTVQGKTKWDLGVARESINRKGKIMLKPQNGYWTVVPRNGNEYKANAGHPVTLSLRKKPHKVGVFVDYEEGQVSFYDVEARSHIYSYTGCIFTEKLYTYFIPCNNAGGKNSAPLIISSVNLQNGETYSSK